MPCPVTQAEAAEEEPVAAVDDGCGDDEGDGEEEEDEEDEEGTESSSSSSSSSTSVNSLEAVKKMDSSIRGFIARKWVDDKVAICKNWHTAIRTPVMEFYTGSQVKSMTQADAKKLTSRGVGKGLAREVITTFRGLKQTACCTSGCDNIVLIAKGEKGQFLCVKTCREKEGQEPVKGKAAKPKPKGKGK
eukprot:gene3743-7384_t